MPRQGKAGPGLSEAEHQIGIPWQNDQGQWWVRRPGDGKAVRWSPGFLQGAAVGGDHPRGPGPRVANPSYPVLRFFERLKHNFKRLFGRHSISPVPRACKIHADKPARQALHKLVGRKVSDAEIAMLACAPDGADVDVRCDSAGGRITISMSEGGDRGPRLETMRVLQRDKDGTLFCENELFETEHLPPGVGTELFYRQVQALLTLGVRYIDTMAVGGPNDRRHNGSYTWPRLGYSSFLSRLTLDRLPPNLQQQMGSSNDILDLMKTPEGRDWWKANGHDVPCTFDLAPGSRNLQTLVAYLQERRQAVAAGARRRGSLPRHGKAIHERQDRLMRRYCYDDELKRRVPCPPRPGPPPRTREQRRAVRQVRQHRRDSHDWVNTDRPEELVRLVMKRPSLEKLKTLQEFALEEVAALPIVTERPEVQTALLWASQYLSGQISRETALRGILAGNWYRKPVREHDDPIPPQQQDAILTALEGVMEVQLSLDSNLTPTWKKLQAVLTLARYHRTRAAGEAQADEQQANQVYMTEQRRQLLRQSEALRNLFPNPMEDDTAPATPDVQQLAQSILQSETPDPSDLGILADALEDAGAAPQVLRALRSGDLPQQHWARRLLQRLAQEGTKGLESWQAKALPGAGFPRRGKAFPGHVRGLARRMRDDWNHEAYLQPLADALEAMGAHRMSLAVLAGADPDDGGPDGANALDVMEAILENDEYLMPMGLARLEFARFKRLALWRSKGLRPPVMGTKSWKPGKILNPKTGKRRWIGEGEHAGQHRDQIIEPGTRRRKKPLGDMQSASSGSDTPAGLPSPSEKTPMTAPASILRKLTPGDVELAAFVRGNVEAVRQNASNRGVSVDIGRAVQLDDARRQLVGQVQGVKQQQNTLARSIPAQKDPAARQQLIEQGRLLRQQADTLEGQLRQVESDLHDALLALPNMTSPDAPVGHTDADNVVVRTHGEPRQFDFLPRDNIAITDALGLVDYAAGAAVAGQKFYYLKGDAALLELGLVQFAMSKLARRGYLPVITPDLARTEVLEGIGFQPRDPDPAKRQVYTIADSDLCLVGTAEITLGGMHRGQTFDEAELPKKYVGLSHCFRTEAGAAGRDAGGLYRVHQFTKVEMFVFCTPEQSEAIHQELLGIEEEIFRELGLPYRVLDICTGDLGGPAYRKYDIEAWMPGRGQGGDYGEVTSTSNCTDFQARRLGIRCKQAGQKAARYVHTLNGTAVACTRALLAILENNQQADGTIEIPEALRQWVGKDRIGTPGEAPTGRKSLDDWEDKAIPKRPEGDYFRGRGNRWFRRVRTPGGNVRTVPAKAPPAGPPGPVTARQGDYRPGVARVVTGRGYDQEDIPDAAPRLPEPEVTQYHPPPAPRSSYEVGPQDVIPTPQPSASPGVASTLRRLYGSRDASRTVADLPDSEQLQQATVVPRVWDTGSLHEAHLKKLELGGREYFFKGMTAERDARDSDESRRRLAAAQERAGREAVMSELAEVAGIPALPIRVVEFQGRRGVLADWSEWPTVNDLANHTGKTVRQIVQQDLPGATRMMIFNLLTLASDKHDGNYLVNDQGQLVSLDNEFSLGVVYAFRRDDRAWDWSDMETDICYKCLEYMRQPLDRSVLSEVLDRAEGMAVHLEQTGQSSKAAGLRQRHAILRKRLIDRPTRDGMATTIFDVKDAGQEIAGHQAVAAAGLLQSTGSPEYSVGPSDVVPSGEAIPSDIPEVVLPEDSDNYDWANT